MNEQIKLLAEQAYELCGKHSNNYNGPAFAEKFAELIVRECAEIAEDYGAGTFTVIDRRIKQRFGVE